MRARSRAARAAAGGEAPAPLPWPSVNALVTVAADGFPERVSRVEDDDGAFLALAAPRGRAGELEPPLDGTAFEVRWPGPRGLLVLPVRLAGRTRDEVDLWWVEATGPVRAHQRRRFVRAASTGWPVRVGLTWVLPEEATATGDLVDLSEGGLRARVRGWRAHDGAAVAVRLTLAEGLDDTPGDPRGDRRAGSGVVVTEYELMGTALRVLPAGGPAEGLGGEPGGEPAGGSLRPRAGSVLGGDDLVDVVVELHDAGRDADALRSLVFSWQRASRRT